MMRHIGIRFGLVASVGMLGCSVEPEKPQEHEPATAQQEAAYTSFTSGLATTVVTGTIRGQFRVGPSGAATYTIPLAVVPGTAGVQPKLSLDYSSQAGPGIAGQGWSISGLSSITRCNRTIAQDGVPDRVTYGSTDRFCVDGQRLVFVKTGSDSLGSFWEYRTEIESFARIRAYGGEQHNPTYWEMRTRSGQIFTYGATADSRIEGTPITYYGHPARTCSNGVDTCTTPALAETDAIIDGTVANVQAYGCSLGYWTGHSFCWGNSVNGVCPQSLTKGTFDVALGRNAGTNENALLCYPSNVATTRVPGIRAWAMSKVADTKGNYLRVAYDENATTGEAVVSRIDYTGNDSVPGQIADNQSVRFEYETRPDAGTTYLTRDQIQSSKRLKAIVAYYNRTQIAREYELTYETAPGTGRSRLRTIRECAPEGTGALCFSPTTFTYSNASTTVAAATDWGTALGSNMRSADMNGDGATDLLELVNGEAKVSLADLATKKLSAATTWATGLGTDQRAITLTDMNADGKLDVVRFAPNGNVEVLVSTGTGLNAPVVWATGMGDNPSRLMLADVDGDGRQDLIRIDATDNADNATNLYRLPVGYGNIENTQPGGLSPAEYFRLSTTPRPAADGRLLRKCKLSGVALAKGFESDFVSFDPACEGKTVVGTIGYSYPSTYPDARAFYRCRRSTPVGIDEYPSYDSTCGGATVVETLGYAVPSQTGPGAAIVFPNQGTQFGAARVWATGLGAGVSPDRVVLADFDGDGRTDLARHRDDGQMTFFYSEGFTTAAPILRNLDLGPYPIELRIADVNGDGRADIVRLLALSDPATKPAWVFTAAGRSFNAKKVWATGIELGDQLMDINSDGRPDIFQVTSTGRVRVAFGSVDSSGLPATVPFAEWSTGALHYPIERVTTSTKTGVNMPAAGVAPANTVDAMCKALGYLTGATNVGCAAQSIIPGTNNCTPAAAAYNGTTWSRAISDVPYYGGYGATTRPESTGCGSRATLCPISGTTPQYVNWVDCVKKTSGPVFGDFDADGRLDVLVANDDDRRAFVSYGQGPIVPDTLVTVQNGLGATHSVQYASLTSGLYEPTPDPSTAVNPPPAYPMTTLRGAMAVVSQFSEPNGIGGSKTSTLNYRDGRVDLQGRGFLGFARVGVINTLAEGTRVEQVEEHALAFPYTGAVIYTATRTSTDGGATWTDRSRKIITMATKNIVRDGVTTVFPYVQREWEGGIDLSGAILPSTQINHTYGDDWGNLTYQSRLTSERQSTRTFTTTTRNTYEPADTTRWILGRVKLSEVTQSEVTGYAHGRTSAFEYEPDTGLLKKEILEPNWPAFRLETTRGYDAWGHVTSTTVTGGTAGQPDYVSRTNTTVYDAQGRCAIESRNALGHTERAECDARTLSLTTVTDSNGLVTTNTYDGLGRKTKSVAPDGLFTTYAYETETGFGEARTRMVTRVHSATTSNVAPAHVVIQDVLGREVRTRSEGFDGTATRWIAVDTFYDADGRVRKKTLPYFEGIYSRATADTTAPGSTMVYDALGRVTETTEADGAKTRVAYDGLTETTTNAKNQVTIRKKDARDRLVEVTDAKNGKLTFAHSHDGTLMVQTITDHVGNKTIVKSDFLGRKVEMSDPNLGLTTYKYNAVGDVIEQITPRQRTAGQKTTMTYDALGRLVSRSEQSYPLTTPFVSTWTYDTCPRGSATWLGMICRSQSPQVTRSVTYDALGRAAGETVTVGTDTYSSTNTFDALGRMDRINFPSGLSVRREYNERGFLVRVYDGGTSGVTYWRVSERDALGATVSETLGNGLVTRRSFNPRNGRLEGISTGTTTAPTSVQSASFQYDLLGNLERRTDNVTGLGELYGYDELSRLKSGTVTMFRGTTFSVTPPAGTPAPLSIGYDALGNISSKSDVGTYVYNFILPGATAPLPHAVSQAGSSTFTYDENGNMTSRVQAGVKTTVAWTGFDMPDALTSPAGRAAFIYGPDHQRARQIETTPTARTTTTYVSTHFEAVTRLGLPTFYRHYIQGDGKTVAVVRREGTITETRYLHHDHLGSVQVLTNEAGAVVERLSYDPFGVRRNPDGTAMTTAFSSVSKYARGFTGHEMLDVFGLIHMNGRIQDPKIGRFLSADPFVQAPGHMQSYNRYSYVNNNPLTLTDPSGYFSLKRAIRVIAAVALIAAMAYFGPVGGMSALLNAFIAKFGGSVIVGSIMLGAAGGFVTGLIFTGTLKGATEGAISGAVAGAIGGLQLGPGANWFAHGMHGGITARDNGGKFATGFASSFIAASLAGTAEAAAGKIVSQDSWLRVAVGAAIDATIGGTVSVIGGGKFENGAMSAAYSYLFNQSGGDAHKPDGVAKIRRTIHMFDNGAVMDHFMVGLFDDAGTFHGGGHWTPDTGFLVVDGAKDFDVASRWGTHADEVQVPVNVKASQSMMDYLKGKNLGSAYECGSYCAMVVLGGNANMMGQMPLHEVQFEKWYERMQPKEIKAFNLSVLRGAGRLLNMFIPVMSAGVVWGALSKGGTWGEALRYGAEDWVDGSMSLGGTEAQ